MNYDNIHVLILSAGKIEKELESIFGSIPSGLIPLHGKPVIFRILNKLLKEGFKKVSITTGFKKEILEKAESFDADLIVVGSQGQGAFSRLLLGSVSQYLATHAKCSVMIVKDKDTK